MNADKQVEINQDELMQRRELMKLKSIRLAIAECLQANREGIIKRAAAILKEAGIEVSSKELGDLGLGIRK